MSSSSARRQLEREVRSLKDRLASGSGVDLAAGAVDVQGVKVVATRVDGADAGALRAAVDQLKERLKSAVVVLASVENPEKVLLVAGVTADQTARIKAGELAGAIAAQVGGRGGGRPDFAQAGGSKPEALDAALGSVRGVRARAPDRLERRARGRFCRPCRPSVSWRPARRPGRPPLKPVIEKSACHISGEMAEWSKAHPC